MGKRRKPSEQRCASPAAEALYGSNSLPGLPEELMQLLYDRLTTADLLALLQTSKVMAQRVMQHRSGRLELQVTKAPNKARAATQQLLQWASPACLKLRLHGAGHGPERPGQEPPLQQLDASEVQAVLGEQQLPCLLQLCLKGFVLRTAVPMGLAASCPNIHTLQLETCCVGYIFSSQQDSRHSRHSKGGDCSSADSQTVPKISTLILKNFTMRQQECGAAQQGAAEAEDSRSRRRRVRDEKQQQKEQEAAFLQRWQRDLPDITCLHLQGYKSAPLEVIDLWATQLQELHISVYVSDLPAIWRLHQLRKLVAPNLSGGDNNMEALLKLPHLEHVELLDMHLGNDFSAHPCTWRFLRLHLSTTCTQGLGHLARLPLHSLQAPLELGRGEPDECVRICLLPAPKCHGLYLAAGGVVLAAGHVDDGQVDEWNAGLQKVVHNLGQCGVVVKADHVLWEPNLVDDYRGREAASDREQAATLAAVSPLLGATAHVTLYFMRVGPQVIEALAPAHQYTLRWLTLRYCKADSFDARAAVTQLPSLSKLEFEDCFDDWQNRDHDRVVRLCCGVLDAMAAGPSGRTIDVLVYSRTVRQEVSCEPLMAAIQDQSLHPSRTVQVTATMQVQPYKSLLLIKLERLP